MDGGMMEGTGGMMLGMRVRLLLVVALVLAVATMVKYPFFSGCK